METFIIGAKFIAKIGLLSGVVLGFNHWLNFVHDVQFKFKTKSKEIRRERKNHEIDDLREKLTGRG